MALALPHDAQARLDTLLVRAEETHTDSLAISWHSDSQQWTFGKDAVPILTMSVTKSIVGLVMGRLAPLRKLSSIDEPVHSCFSEWRQGRKRTITVRMLMEHTSGLQNQPMTTVEIYPSPDFVQLALCAELATEPGSTFAYNNKAVNLLAGIVERADGRKLDTFAREELLRPPGITDTPWLRDDAGSPHAMSGLALQATDLTRLGELILQRGEWYGSQLIDKSWFDAMDEPAREGSEPALMWWHHFDDRTQVTEGHVNDLEDTGESIAYRAEGDLGQYVYVVPGTRFVAARLISEATIERNVPDFRTPPKSREEHLTRIEPFLFPDFEELVLGLSIAL